MEVENIINLYKNGLSCAKIQKIYGVDRHKISLILKNNGVNVKSFEKTKDHIICKIKEIVLEDYKNGKSINNLSKTHNVPVSTIRSIIKNNNIIIRRAKYYVDNTFFDNINNEYKAYVLGLLYADGYNHKTGKVLLEMIDFEIVDKVNKILKNEKPIMVRHNRRDNRKPTYRMSVDNIEISRKLIEKGCPQKKSFIIKWPSNEIVPYDLQNHFLRGYFDGDGSFSFNLKSKVKQVQIVSNLDFLNGMIYYLKKEINLSKYHISQRHKSVDNNIRQVHITRWDDVLNFINLIYHNSTIKLERKYLKCLEALNYKMTKHKA